MPVSITIIIFLREIDSFGPKFIKVGQTDPIFGMPSGFLLRLCAEDYKSLCAVVMICSTLVKIQTHTQTAF